MCTVLVAPPMGFTVSLCFLATVLAPCFSGSIFKEVAYECGPHGKFEYCIDDIPGCVIGCHCHPGYYFDTDSKICEPNIKLTQHYRHQYLAEPTPTATAHPTPTATITVNNEDQGVETKDTDELGDWLYNQFFKTIESQVINNSNNTKSNNEKPPTRRSGGGRVNKSKKIMRKPTRRTRKKRKHKKGRGLRRKLLRITEDDSLFDSGSDSDDSDDSSSESGSSSDDSSSADIDSSDDKKTTDSDTDCTDDKDHGHKQVIIFNKRPKLPLPSFIFLPSMDTPYYPPIGLPPPPLVPMYPMVPVPPVAPFPPFPGLPKCDDGSNNAATTTTGGSTTVTIQHTTTTPTPEHIPNNENDAPNKENDVPNKENDVPNKENDVPNNENDVPNNENDVPNNENNVPEDDNPKEGPPGRRYRPKKDQKMTNLEKFIMRANKPGKQNKLKNGQHNKLMQKLRNKLKGKRRNSKVPTHTEKPEAEGLQSVEDVSDIMEDLTPHKQPHIENHIPKLDDVDFKYLSELIHRVNQSRNRNSPPLPFDLKEDLKELQKLQSSQPSRRVFDSYKPVQQVPRQGADEMYYSNLGRQIAAMIRNADSTLDTNNTKDIRQTDLPVHFFLNENGHGPRPFWERSVRSPVLQNGYRSLPRSEYLDESRALKHSNEKSLINLENEVKIFASTPPPLRLQDLENMLSTIHKVNAQIQFKQPTTSTKQSNESMNVNLLPKHVRSAYSKSFFNAPEKVEYIPEHYQTPPPAITPLYAEMHPAAVANTSVFLQPEIKYNVPYSDYWMFNPVPIQTKPKPRFLIAQTNKPIASNSQIYYTNPVKPIMSNNQIYYTNPVKQPFRRFVQPTRNETKKLRVERLQPLVSKSLTTQITSKTRKPKVVKYKSLNYFSGNKHFMFEAASYPFLGPFKMPVSKRIFNNNPSYFHQQSHRFEYFD